jgi:hypothetical protein
MSRRTSTMQALVAHIEHITGITGRRGLQFLHEINTFPSFYIHPRLETRTHISHGVKLAVITCDLRVYTYTDRLGSVELEARNVETAVQTFARQHLDLVDECRVISVRTDEGIMSPYGLVDMSIELLYRIEQ